MAEEKQLHVYCNDVIDWVSAYDVADAIKVWEETYGEKWADYAPPGEDGWEQEPDDALLAIHEEELINPEPFPALGVVIEGGEGRKTIRATMRAWADARGRGLLCSTEY